MIQGKILSYGDDLSEAFNIRRKVFVEELKMQEEKEFDVLDNEAMHVIVYDITGEKKAVATGRINYDGNVCVISKVSVLQEYRSMKYGDFTVRMLINKAITAGINVILVNSPLSVAEFYKKIGFKIDGEKFIDSGISYYKMVIDESNIVKICNKCNN